MSGAVQQSHDDHGHSVAAWTAVGFLIVGTLVGAAAFALGSPAIFWVGLALGAVGLVAGKVLQAMGFGAAARTATTATTPERVSA